MRVWRVVTKATGSEGDIICRMAHSHSHKRYSAVLGVGCAKFRPCCTFKIPALILIQTDLIRASGYTMYPSSSTVTSRYYAEEYMVYVLLLSETVFTTRTATTFFFYQLADYF